MRSYTAFVYKTNLSSSITIYISYSIRVIIGKKKRYKLKSIPKRPKLYLRSGGETKPLCYLGSFMFLAAPLSRQTLTSAKMAQDTASNFVFKSTPLLTSYVMCSDVSSPLPFLLFGRWTFVRMRAIANRPSERRR